MRTTNTSARKCVHGVALTKPCTPCHPWLEAYRAAKRAEAVAK